ncbi:MAG: hypothetical protein WBC85_01590 [Planktotalea sp.]|uniref:hypothetical protein n=1 Tax=Planktotalea sp. TaxID=2029877 RepID=UPI003C78139D
MFKALTVLLGLTGAPVMADALADMQGTWSGSGWAREAASGPKEAVRCRIKNSYDEGARALSVSGRCVVPGRKIALAGEIKGNGGSAQISGHWFNPDGLGSVRISGLQQADLIAFTFRAKDPETGAVIAQNVEWRVSAQGLHLRATDRADPGVKMSDIAFTRQ